MLVVIAMGTVVLAAAVGTVTALLRFNDRGQRQSAAHAAVRRLADQFRRDVHAGTRFEKLEAGKPAGPGWQLQLSPDRSVGYRVARGEVVRTEHAGGKVCRRESYRLPPQTAVSAALENLDGATLVSLRLFPAGVTAGLPGGRATPTPAPLSDRPVVARGADAGQAIRIDAELGKDARTGAGMKDDG
jgi:type II secretory pathway pseudopilin PulG